jgi:hypothetical protein
MLTHVHRAAMYENSTGYEYHKLKRLFTVNRGNGAWDRFSTRSTTYLFLCALSNVVLSYHSHSLRSNVGTIQELYKGYCLSSFVLGSAYLIPLGLMDKSHRIAGSPHLWHHNHLTLHRHHQMYVFLQFFLCLCAEGPQLLPHHRCSSCWVASKLVQTRHSSLACISWWW